MGVSPRIIAITTSKVVLCGDIEESHFQEGRVEKRDYLVHLQVLTPTCSLELMITNGRTKPLRGRKKESREAPFFY